MAWIGEENEFNERLFGSERRESLIDELLNYSFQFN